MKAARWMMMFFVMTGAAALSHAQGQRGQGQWGQGRQLDRITLDVAMNGAEYNGNHVIRLRQLINQRNPWFQTRDFRLENVTIWAKSRQGQGMLNLQINGQIRDRVQVPGNEYQYFRNDSQTYFQNKMWNSSYAQDPSWVLQTSGNIRILKMRFTLVEERGGYPNPGGSQIVGLGSGKFDKLIDDRNTHEVRVNKVRELRIVSQGLPFLVREVVLVHANGYFQRIAYQQTVEPGRELRIPMQNVDLRRVEITGTSTVLVGSRADYRLEAVVSR